MERRIGLTEYWTFGGQAERPEEKRSPLWGENLVKRRTKAWR